MSTVVVDSAKIAEKGKKVIPSKITITDEEIIFSSIIGEAAYYKIPRKGIGVSLKNYKPSFKNALTATIKGFIIFYAFVYLVLITIIWGTPQFILPSVIINTAKSIESLVIWKHEEVFVIFLAITFIALWLINLDVVLKTEKEELHVYGKRWKLKPLMLLSEKSKSRMEK